MRIGFSMDCTARYGDCAMHLHIHCTGCYGVLYREGDGGYVDECGKDAHACAVCGEVCLCKKCESESVVCPQCASQAAVAA